VTESPPSWRLRLRPALLLPLVLLGGLVVRLVLAMVLPPGYDEAYYLFYGRHLALSYFDHPAAVGLWAWVGTRLGGSILALRVPSLLSYTLALALLSGATERWFGRRAALFSAVLGSVAPVLFLCGGLLLLPDSPLLLALAALLWWLSRHPRVVPASPRHAIGLGVLLGMVTLGKYHALLVLISLLAWCLVSGERRRHFRSPWPGLALLVWLLVSAPLWLWNLNNGWASFLFQGGRIGAGGGYDLAAPPLFLLSQLVLLFPTVGVVLLLALGPRSSRDGASDHRQLLRWLVVPQLVVFLLLAGRMQVLSSWLVPAWWLLLPLAGDWLAGPHDRLWRRGIMGGSGATALLLPTLLFTLALQVRWGVLDRWLPPGLDTSAELMTSENLRKALRGNPGVWKALRDANLIAGNRYDLPGLLALAVGSESKANYTTFSNDSRGFAWWQPTNGFKGASGVFFGIVEPEKPLSRESWWPLLGKVERLGIVVVHRAGRPSLRLEFIRYGPLPNPWPRRYGPGMPLARLP